MTGLNDLNRFRQTDIKKRVMIENLLVEEKRYLSEKSMRMNLSEKMIVEGDWACDADMSFAKKAHSHKVCPKCSRSFTGETICPDCLVLLKSEDDFKKIEDIEIVPEFIFEGSTDYGSFDELLSEKNFRKLNESYFTIKDYEKIAFEIRRQAYTRLNRVIVENDIEIDELDILDTVILFAKSFVEIAYKSSGMELGYFEFNRITVDDRQTPSHQITTVFHELSHFLLKEMLTHSLCMILDTTKNEYVESFITYELTKSDLCRLIDEYCAHTVEGRFTLFGYQDYSSFLTIQHCLGDDEVDTAKMIGNTFANTVKDIIEGFIDRDLRDEIKRQFMIDHTERPDYASLRHESCHLLNPEGLCTAVKLLLNEAFQTADTEVLNAYLREFMK